MIATSSQFPSLQTGPKHHPGDDTASAPAADNGEQPPPPTASPHRTSRPIRADGCRSGGRRRPDNGSHDRATGANGGPATQDWAVFGATWLLIQPTLGEGEPPRTRGASLRPHRPSRRGYARTSVPTGTAAAHHDAKTDVHRDPVAPVSSTAQQTVDQEAPTAPTMVCEGSGPGATS